MIWIDEINQFTPESFVLGYQDGWSASQVVDHIFKTSIKCVSNALLCFEAKGENGHSGFGPAIFSMMGAFPPIRIKMKNPPESVTEIYFPKKQNQSQSIVNLNNALHTMELALPRVEAANPSIRIAHWAGGWFNANQWYHCAEMHINHHFRQLKRIKKQAERS